MQHYEYDATRSTTTETKKDRKFLACHSLIPPVVCCYIKCSDSGHGSRESAVSTMVVELVSSPTAVWVVSWLALE